MSGVLPYISSTVRNNTMTLLKTILRNWIHVIALTLFGIFVLFNMISAGSVFYRQYHVKVSDKRDAVLRLKHMCQDAETVHTTNYGETCRRYEHASQIVPSWEAIEAVADSYRLCDARSGCGAGVIILGAGFVASAGILYGLYTMRNRYPTYIDQFNSDADASFMHNHRGVYRHPGHLTVHEAHRPVAYCMSSKES